MTTVPFTDHAAARFKERLRGDLHEGTALKIIAAIRTKETTPVWRHKSVSLHHYCREPGCRGYVVAYCARRKRLLTFYPMTWGKVRRWVEKANSALGGDQ